jgi:hypothetical protein
MHAELAGRALQRFRLRPAAIQRRLHAAHRRFDEFRDFLQRIFEHILQQHTRAFFGAGGSPDRRTDHRPDGIAWLDKIRLRGGHLCFDSHAPASQKIDALIARSIGEAAAEDG